MPELVLGSEVAHLRVILQSGAGIDQKFAIRFPLPVEPADLVGVNCALVLGETTFAAVLTDTTYTWTFSESDVEALSSRTAALLKLYNIEGGTLLGRGIVEVRS